MPEWIGKTIGKVRIEKLLARGEMAEVYLGTHITLERSVVVKLLHIHIDEEPSLRERFHRGTKVVASLRYPNIVQIFDFDTIDGRPYIVMEYIKGPSLSAGLRALDERNERIPLDQAARLINEVTAALDYAHDQGVIHGQLKPGNILLDSKVDTISLDQWFAKDVKVMVTDFGLTRIMYMASQSASGRVSGTPAYMSPEQARGDQIDARTDIYSLGVILYEMLAGQTPFESGRTTSTIDMQTHSALPPIVGVSPEVQAVLDRARKKDPNDRYQTGREMATDLFLSIGMTAAPNTIHEDHLGSIKQAVLPDKQKPAKSKPAKKLSLSISFPKLLSKHVSSKFLVQFYFPLTRLSVQDTIKQELGRKNVSEHIYMSDLIPGKRIKVNLTCPDIEFTAPIIRTLHETSQFLFLGKPKNNCEPATHQILLEITDVETNEQLHALFFPVKVVDLVFGYISRPFLSNVSTAILGISSVIMFILTLIGQVDQTWGLTSGTTVGIIASIIYTRFIGSYNSQRMDVLRT